MNKDLCIFTDWKENYYPRYVFIESEDEEELYKKQIKYAKKLNSENDHCDFSLDDRFNINEIETI